HRYRHRRFHRRDVPPRHQHVGQIHRSNVRRPSRLQLAMGAFVAGIEGDIQNSRQSERTTTFACARATCNPALGAFGFDVPVTARMEQRLEWFGTLRGRLGVTPTAGSLVYATGGLAVGRIKTSGTVGGSNLGLTEDVIIDVDPDGNPIEIPVVTASANP